MSHVARAARQIAKGQRDRLHLGPPGDDGEAKDGEPGGPSGHGCADRRAPRPARARMPERPTRHEPAQAGEGRKLKVALTDSSLQSQLNDAVNAQT